MSLTADEVRWVAHLARLHLSDSELHQMTGQLSGILDYINQLQQVNTDGVEPMAHRVAICNAFRADERQASLSVDAALANAPLRRANFYCVPAVMD
jgi:aspartyl-tRNA(Asn)/glutamyl-tRNA(Gln) amidotransferase subunit C